MKLLNVGSGHMYEEVETIVACTSSDGVFHLYLISAGWVGIAICLEMNNAMNSLFVLQRLRRPFCYSLKAQRKFEYIDTQDGPVWSESLQGA